MLEGGQDVRVGVKHSRGWRATAGPLAGCVQCVRFSIEDYREMHKWNHSVQPDTEHESTATGEMRVRASSAPGLCLKLAGLPVQRSTSGWNLSAVP